MSDSIRPTRQRQVVSDALAELETFCSAQEIHALLSERGENVGLATVYRTLQLFADAGSLDALRGDDGETRYRRCSSGHHHHLVCRDCGRTVEVEGPTVERWADRVAGDHGFTDVSHTLEIFGSCANCRRRSP
ncbi:MAG TPA: Fur family transcriptional regulator [Aeromicrobium sp.]|nr:Fur family transcriptional regulator [Aeromicrobium sp.]